MTLCHMTWILFLEAFTECPQSVRIRTDNTLDQDSELKATVQVCTACMDVSFLTTCMHFNNSSSRADCTFRCKSRESNTEEKHVCQLKAFKLQSVEATTAARVPSQPGPEKASALSLSSSRVIGLQVGL